MNLARAAGLLTSLLYLSPLLSFQPPRARVTCTGYTMLDYPVKFLLFLFSHLDAMLLKLSDLSVHVFAGVTYRNNFKNIKTKCHSFLTIGHVSVRVVALDQEAVAIEDSEAVDDVGAQAVVNVLRIKLASACLPAGWSGSVYRM